MSDFKIILRKDGKKLTIRSNRDRFFFPDEWMRFYEILKKTQKLTFGFLINTGARINEARHVKVADIDFENKSITLRVTKSRSFHSTGKKRIIPISSQFCKTLYEHILIKRLDNEDYLGILSTPAANIAMKNALKRAGIQDWYMFSVHNIRKTLENWLMILDVSLVKLTLHFGHDITTARKHYLISQNPIKREAIREILGDLYYGNGQIDELYDRVKKLEAR